MNSRLDWLVLSGYYSIYVTNAPPEERNTNPCGSYFFLFTFVRGFERVGRQLVTTVLIFRKNEPTKQPTERLFATPA